MIKTEFELQFSTECFENNKLPVIVVAAGSSSRMKGINKLFLDFGGMPLVVKTLMAFEKSPLISKIILVTSEENVLEMERLSIEYKITKLTDITVGGANRFSSVLNGIEKLDVADEKVLIHDGARPFVDNKVIGNVCAALQNYDAAVCAVHVKDTVKIANENGNVRETPDRNTLFSAQTPQGVDVKKYKAAAEKIADKNFITDDASVMEAGGYNVKIVMGDYKNSESYMKTLLKAKEYAELDAVKNKKVYFLPKELFQYKPCGRWAESYRYISSILNNE